MNYTISDAFTRFVLVILGERSDPRKNYEMTKSSLATSFCVFREKIIGFWKIDLKINILQVPHPYYICQLNR